MLTLYDYYRSSSAFRVRIALNLKKLSYKIEPIHLVKEGGEQFGETYSQLNPMHLVPTLIDNDKVITQSLAIIEYLDETYPTPALSSFNSYERALIRSFALTIACDVQPLNNLRVLKYLSEEMQLNEEQKKKWYEHWIHLAFSALEAKLKNQASKGRCAFFDYPTIADIFLVPQMYNARRFSCDLSAFPLLTKIDAYCQTLPAFQKAWPMENE